MGKNKLRQLGDCGFNALLLSRVTAPCHFRLICSFISNECGEKTRRAVLAQVRSASPSFLYFAFSVLSPLALPLSYPRREPRVCLRPVSLRPSPHFFISPDRFPRAPAVAAERQMKGTREGGEVCGMKREAANMRSVCFSSGFGFHPSLSSVIIRFFFSLSLILCLIC